MKARVIVSNNIPMLLDEDNKWLPPCDIAHWHYFKENEGKTIEVQLCEFGDAIGWVPSYNNPDNSNSEPDTIQCETCIPVYPIMLPDNSNYL